jgi:hypothetical protein
MLNEPTRQVEPLESLEKRHMGIAVWVPTWRPEKR